MECTLPVKPSSKICQAIDVVRRIMEQRRFGLHDGSVFKLAPDAVSTFVYCSSVNSFVMNLLSNGEVADAVVPYINQVVALLSEPACRIIEPIVIDFNLIECLPSGTVFNIWKSVLNTWVK